MDDYTVVSGHRRRNGTYVQPYIRRLPGRGRDYEFDDCSIGGFDSSPWDYSEDYAEPSHRLPRWRTPMPEPFYFPEPEIIYRRRRPPARRITYVQSTSSSSSESSSEEEEEDSDVDSLTGALGALTTRDRTTQPSVDSGVLSAALLQQLRDSNHIIPYKDIRFNTTEDLIGKGSFGTVYKAIWQTAIVALKKLDFQDCTKTQLNAFKNEVRVLARARHPHVVQFLGACDERRNLSIVTELLGGGNLWNALHVDDDVTTGWSREKRVDILKQACSGLLYLHHLGVAHRDVKSANLLLSADVTTCKVADFGLSRVRNASMTSSTRLGPRAIGTLLYAAPEMLEGKDLGLEDYEKADVYSFAIVSAEVLTGLPPYEEPEWTEQQLRQRVCVQGERPRLPADLAPHIRSATERAWDKDPSRRPTMGQLFCVLNGEPLPEGPGSGVPGTSRGSPDTLNLRECVVDLENPPNAMLKPCRHAVMCEDCVLRMMNGRTDRDVPKCPICRVVIEGYVLGTYNESLVR